MAYISLYRKYRPQTFDDVVGQDHVTTTLRNAIAAGRIASGYLFCGTRGTAKTTCARILAKALNCIGPDGSLTEMTPNPCGVCEPCQSIAASSFVDVLELDAASHGKVDDVRDLVASIKYPPIDGRYKVYIIDEAHQLSRDAMDAFLKTLEEPPQRVVFVLATTELEKLPITIASRCQVYEFKRGSVAQISSRLQKVLQDEGVVAEPAAVTLVARGAEGSYRDSLSLLEQVLAYKPDNIVAGDVTTVLGAVDDDVLARIATIAATGDAAGAFSVIADLLTAGKDVRQVLRTVSEHFRDMLAIRVGASMADTEIVASASITATAKQFSPAALLRILSVLSDAERDIRWNTQHRLLLETTFLKMMELPQDAPRVIAPQPTAPATEPIRAEATARAEQQRPVQAPRSEPAAQTEHTAQTTPPPAPAASAVPFDLDDEEEDDDDLSPVADLDDEPIIARSASSRDLIGDDDLLQLQQVSVTETIAPAPVARVVPAGQPADLLKLQRSWQEVINRFGSRSPSGLPTVKDARPAALEGSTFILGFNSQFHLDRLEKNEKGRKALEEVINKTLDVGPGTYKVRCMPLAQAELMANQSRAMDQKTGVAPRETIVAPEPLKTESAIQFSAQPAMAEPESDLVEDVIAVFGGRILDDDMKGY